MEARFVIEVALGMWRAHLAVNQTSRLWRFDSVCYHCGVLRDLASAFGR